MKYDSELPSGQFVRVTFEISDWSTGIIIRRRDWKQLGIEHEFHLAHIAKFIESRGTERLSYWEWDLMRKRV